MTNEAAVSLLGQWVADEQLMPQVSALVDDMRRSHGYSVVLEKKGADQAEEWLAATIKKYRASEFAHGIEPVALGMLKYAQADPKGKYVSVITPNDRGGFPFALFLDKYCPAVIIFNRFAPGCGCNQAEGVDEFGSDAALGLRAVSLQVGHSVGLCRTEAQLNLVLPCHKRGYENDAAYTVVRVMLDGHTGAWAYSLRASEDIALQYSIGMIDAERALSNPASSLSLSEAIGPGGRDYLADALPRLGTYLTNLASKIGEDHAH